jgi:hypothetical protein
MASAPFSIEFTDESRYIDTVNEKRKIHLTVQEGEAKWHVRITFPGEDGQITDSPMAWRDFEKFCRCIDFGPIDLLNDTCTELVLSREQIVGLPWGVLPLKEYPVINSAYAEFRETSLFFRTKECRKHTQCFYTGKSRVVQHHDVQSIAGLDQYTHVLKATIVGDSTVVVYKTANKYIDGVPPIAVVEQELRNLHRFKECPQIVRFVAAVVAPSPYQTLASKPTSVLRGILIEYHENGNLEDFLQVPKPEIKRSANALRWALDVATALSFMHEKGVAHMDVKSMNVVLSANWRAILIDVSGNGGFTESWLLPELERDRRARDPLSAPWELRVRSDAWALGMIVQRLAKMLNIGCKSQDDLYGIAQDVEETNGRLQLATIAARLAACIAGLSCTEDDDRWL